MRKLHKQWKVARLRMAYNAYWWSKDDKIAFRIIERLVKDLEKSGEW